MSTPKELQSKDYNKYLLNTYNRHNVNFVKGEGCKLYDEKGKEYLDMLCGIAVTGFGHNHPKLVSTAVEQVMNLWHVSNLFESGLQASLAEKLTTRTGLSSVFFCNSGTEANEAAIKFARKYGQGRSDIITTLGGFHGRTMGSLSASGQYKLWDGFHPLTPGFKYVPYDDIDAIMHSIDKHTVAIMIEPIQGESGINIPGDDYMARLRQICDEYDLLLIMDEVQSGIGRTGKLFAYQWENVLPDIISSAKGIANGLPLGAVICSEKVSKIIKPGMHGSTFGGNPVAVAVANMVMDLLTDEMLDGIKESGKYISEEIKKLENPAIKEMRGRGLMIGIELEESVPAADISNKLLENGILTVIAGGNVVRLLPPYLISKDEIEKFLGVFADTLNNYIHKMNIQKQLQTK